jgi:8-oxo-dGTP pyrophosphatase MutT (NUDIX family)
METVMRTRPSSRLLVLDPRARLLLFKFEHKKGPLAGQNFWATPGGGLHRGEDYSKAACRELLEETGFLIDDPGPVVDQRTVPLQLPDGEWVRADERFFLVRIEAAQLLSTNRWTEFEHEVMAAHRWWPADELRSTAEQVWPENLPEVLARIGVWSGTGV